MEPEGLECEDNERPECDEGESCQGKVGTVCENSEQEANLITRTIRQEIPFASGSIVIVSEISLNLDKGSVCPDSAFSEYMKNLAGSIKKVKVPETEQPEKLKGLFQLWTKNIEQEIRSEAKREVPNTMKIEFLKQILLRVEEGELLLGDGDYGKALSYLTGAVNAFYPAREFPDDPTLGVMFRETVKACDFVTPVIKFTRVGKLARFIGNKIRGTVKGVLADGVGKRGEATGEEPVGN